MEVYEAMRLKIPPAGVFLIFAVLMYGADRVLPVGDFDFFGRTILLRFLILAGIILGVLALLQFAKHKTSSNPLKIEKATTLVTNGVYRISRNPMYLGLLLILLAWGLYLGNAFNAITAAGFVSYMNAFQIRQEEEILRQKFGEHYNRYCKAVRRWF